MDADLGTPAAALGGEQAAIARSRALALVADLWGRGLQPGTLDAWRQVPDLGVDLPDTLDADAVGAVHVRMTQTLLFPYESVFLDDGGLLGGDHAAAVRQARAGAGLGPPRELEADHLAEELRLLAFLLAAEADALRDGVDPAHVRHHQAAFLDQHLLRWLPAFVAAVEGLALSDGASGSIDRLYPSSVRLALELVVDWRRQLPGAPGSWALPELRPGLLEDERTGLGRIARRLCTAALCGAFLSQDAIRRAGRGQDLPGGFGKRWQVLESVLAAAAHYQAVPAVLAALDDELSRHDAVYAAVGQALPESVAPWRERLAEGRALVAQLDAAVQAG